MINFASDNVWGVHPHVMDALQKASKGADSPYGDDKITQAVQKQMNSLFEKEVAYLPLVSGTAANGLSLALCANPVQRILCSRHAHLWESECGAIENYTGGASLEFVEDSNGKVNADALKELLSRPSHGFHRQEPAVLSIAQTTEIGTVYTPDEIKALSRICKAHNLYLHMDGARLANAVALYPSLSLSELTWRLGVDILSFGFSKNGAMGAEAVIVFNENLSQFMMPRAKRAGIITSKMRFISAQIEAMLHDDLWRRLGEKANQSAQELYDALIALPPVMENVPFESNQIFVNLSPDFKEKLQQKGFLFHDWPSLGKDCVRIICSSEIDNNAIKTAIYRAKEALE